MLSARGREEDKVAGLDAGVDDYVAKLFGMPKLMAHLRAVLRRTTTSQAPEPILMCGDLALDLVDRTCRRERGPIQLTPLEFAMLAVPSRDGS